MRHATDPDHVVAVATIVSRERSLRAAAPIGIFWGFGHTATLVAVSFAIIAFGVVIPPPRARHGFSVSLMLVLLGVWNLLDVLRGARRGARHVYGGVDRLDRWISFAAYHRYGRSSSASSTDSPAPPPSGQRARHHPRPGLLYLTVFGGGTIAGMLVMTTLLALPIVFSAGRFHRVHRVFATRRRRWASASAPSSRTRSSEELFSAAPQWTPG